jgi:hypothetical protein
MGQIKYFWKSTKKLVDLNVRLRWINIDYGQVEDL